MIYERSRRLAPVISALIPLVVVIVSCRSVPHTYRPQLVVISAETELAMGESAYRELMQYSRKSSMDRLVRIVNRVGGEIAAVSGRNDYKWEFNLIESDSPNAFCLPGGKVGVNTGILSIAKNEAGLAAIIAHEVGHAIAGHGAERMSHSMIIDFTGGLLAKGVPGDQAFRAAFRSAYGGGFSVAFALPFSRKHELEADHLGLLMMANAGYDPEEGRLFWARYNEFSDQGDKKLFSTLFSTHPASAKRITRIDSLMSLAVKEYEKATEKHGAGEQLL